MENELVNSRPKIQQKQPKLCLQYKVLQDIFTRVNYFDVNKISADDHLAI